MACNIAVTAIAPRVKRPSVSSVGGPWV